MFCPEDGSSDSQQISILMPLYSRALGVPVSSAGPGWSNPDAFAANRAGRTEPRASTLLRRRRRRSARLMGATCKQGVSGSSPLGYKSSCLVNDEL